jgi:hypothetical protein
LRAEGFSVNCNFLSKKDPDPDSLEMLVPDPDLQLWFLDIPGLGG